MPIGALSVLRCHASDSSRRFMVRLLLAMARGEESPAGTAARLVKGD